MGFVSQIRWAELWSILTPSECIQADANVMLQIKAIYADIQCYIKAYHMKGHQESKKTRSANKTTMNQRLSWET
eukprot:2197905-Ditylum_brightwellii.AAC.1